MRKFIVEIDCTADSEITEGRNRYIYGDYLFDSEADASNYANDFFNMYGTKNVYLISVYEAMVSNIIHDKTVAIRVAVFRNDKGINSIDNESSQTLYLCTERNYAGERILRFTDHDQKWGFKTQWDVETNRKVQ